MLMEIGTETPTVTWKTEQGDVDERDSSVREATFRAVLGKNRAGEPGVAGLVTETELVLEVRCVSEKIAAQL